MRNTGPDSALQCSTVPDQPSLPQPCQQVKGRKWLFATHPRRQTEPGQPAAAEQAQIYRWHVALGRASGITTRTITEMTQAETIVGNHHAHRTGRTIPPTTGTTTAVCEKLPDVTNQKNRTRRTRDRRTASSTAAAETTTIMSNPHPRHTTEINLPANRDKPIRDPK